MRNRTLKTSILVLCLISMCSGLNPLSTLSQKFQNYYYGLKNHIEEGFSEVYTGMNLIFKFDEEAYYSFIRHKHPEMRYTEKLIQDGVIPSSSRFTRRNMQFEEESSDSTDSLSNDDYEPTEVYHNPDTCELPVVITQNKFYCDEKPVTHKRYIEHQESNDDGIKCAPPVQETNTVCYCPYGKYTMDCLGPVRMHCAVSPADPQNEEKCVKDNVQVNLKINCTQGVSFEPFYSQGAFYHNVVDIKPYGDWEFWLRDTDNMIFLPYDMKIEFTLKARDFKYLSKSTDFKFLVDDPKVLVGKKEMAVNMDINSLPQSSKPGGRIYYQVDVEAGTDVTSDSIATFLYNRTGYLDLCDYQEPSKSLIDSWFGWLF